MLNSCTELQDWRDFQANFCQKEGMVQGVEKGDVGEQRQKAEFKLLAPFPFTVNFLDVLRKGRISK